MILILITVLAANGHHVICTTSYRRDPCSLYINVEVTQMILPIFYMNFQSKSGKVLVMFDGYENSFFKFDICVGAKKKSAPNAQIIALPAPMRPKNAKWHIVLRTRRKSEPTWVSSNQFLTLHQVALVWRTPDFLLGHDLRQPSLYSY